MWKKWTTLTGSSGVPLATIGTGFNELLIDVHLSGWSTRMVSIHIAKEQLSDSNKEFVDGYYHAPDQFMWCGISVTNTRIQLVECYYNMQNTTANTSANIYYR